MNLTPTHWTQAYRRFHDLAGPRWQDRLALLWLFLRIGAAIPRLAWSIRRLPLPMLLQRLTTTRPPTSRIPKSGSPSENPSQSAIRNPQSAIAPIISCTDYWLGRRVLCYQPTCLLRALTLYRFLREAGLPVVIHYGAAHDGDRLTGHSWLTLDGRPYLEPHDPETRFRRVYSYPPGE